MLILIIILIVAALCLYRRIVTDERKVAREVSEKKAQEMGAVTPQYAPNALYKGIPGSTRKKKTKGGDDLLETAAKLNDSEAIEAAIPAAVPSGNVSGSFKEYLE